MSLGNLMKSIWGDPLATAVDVERVDSIDVHRRIIDSKPLLRATYTRWYHECLRAYRATRHLEGVMLEVGSGAGFLDELIPGLIKTDVVPSKFAHRTLDAMHMDLASASAKLIILVEVMHHLADPAMFLAEAQRCLVSGGHCVLIEPNNSAVERFLCKYLDHYEYFDDSITEWRNDRSKRMEHANLALPWVIFRRDEKRFRREFPGFEMKPIRYHTFLSYVLSGGMSYRSFLPSRIGSAIADAIEIFAGPFMKQLGTAMTVVLVRR